MNDHPLSDLVALCRRLADRENVSPFGSAREFDPHVDGEELHTELVTILARLDGPFACSTCGETHHCTVARG